jgi:hypothetical protein
VRSISQVESAATMLLWLRMPNYLPRGKSEQPVCEVGRDYFPRHRRLLRGDSSPRRRRARARIADHYQPHRFIPSSRRDSWIRIGRRKGS